MDKILRFIEKNIEFQRIFTEIKSHKRPYVCNTNEENAILTISAMVNKMTDVVFLVTPNLYRAQLVYDTLSSTLGEDIVSFFPQDEFITNEMLAASMEFRFERIRTILKLLSNKTKLVVTNLYGILKPELPVDNWLDSKIILNVNQEYDINGLVRKLVNYGYTREYLVEKVGDFSLRGGILDIYPLGSKEPIRVDFFGDEIEVIKEFDLDTQRSIKKISSVEIMPMTEFFYTEQEYNLILGKVQDILSVDSFSEEAKRIVEKDLDLMKNHEELDRLIRYIPFLTDKHISLVDMVENRKLIFLDYQRVLQKNDILLNEISNWYENSKDYVKLGFEMIYDLNRFLVQPNLCIDYLEYNYKDPFDVKISIFSKEVITFNNNIELLFREISKNKNYKTMVFAFEKANSMQDFIDKLFEKKISYKLLSSQDEIVEGCINVLLDEKCYDVNSVSYNLEIITENALKKSFLPRKRGSYVKIYRSAQKLSDINELKPGDYIVHYDYGIGKFLEIKTMQFGNTKNDYIHIEYRGGDKLYVALDAIGQIHKYTGSEGYQPKLSKLGGNDWKRTKERVRNQVQEIAERLVKIYASREKAEGIKFKEFADLEKDFRDSFPYKETIDQNKAIDEVLSDMSKSIHMDRLICGDVGFGKTEIALRAAFKAVLNGKQVAYLAPTTVLSKQHYETFVERMNDYGINVSLLNRFITKKQQRETLQKLKEGLVDILIGTHRILSKDIEFKSLGLLVIDEEQRFGVIHKEKIKEMKANIDVLSLSATPIPRTLNMAIMGVKNMSIIETPPENRYPIQTYVLERNDIIIRDAIERELARNGQVFYLYNKVENIDFIADDVQELVPEARINVIHGKMHKNDLEKVVNDFVNKEIDVLISTTIIETGIDIPNANTLIIHDADMLGLSQLYQIRGRVGRSDRIAYAYLMYKKNKILTEEAEKRLKVIKEFTELGSGFKIAIRDLSIRGAGDVLGKEQSGFIDSVGIDMYMRILEEEVNKTKSFKKQKESKTGVKTNVSKFIDKQYIEDDYIKIEMHKKINQVESTDAVIDLLNEIKDRFGSYSNELEIYIYEKLFESLTKRLDVEKLIETNSNITMVLSENSSKTIAGDKIFKTGIDISDNFRFAYKNNKIRIILDTIHLKNHWLYTMVEFIEKILK